MNKIIINWIFLSIALVTAPYVWAHSENELTERTIYKGIEPFDAKEFYTITLKSDQGREDMKRRKAYAQENGLSVASKAKSNDVKNEAYLQIAKMLSAGSVFRIERAYDAENGDLEVVVASKELLDVDSIKNNSQVSAIKLRDENVHSIKTVTTPDTSIKDINIPENWNKEIGFTEVFRFFGEGAELVKASIVFNKTEVGPGGYYTQPYREIIMNLIGDLRGQGFGYGEDEERKIAWWTQEIDLEQAQELYEKELVVNIISHSE